MKYNIENKQFDTRKEARQYLRSIGKGKDIKSQIEREPETLGDYSSQAHINSGYKKLEE